MSLRAIFDDAMAACGPFEPRPHLAVAVSGGADSLALCLLARDWVERRHGKITALTIDHGLRQESAAEARDVAGLCADLRVDHRVLPWIGAKPRSAIQAQARAARYRLLTGWCGVNGVLHLLVGHHRDDQDETLMMRRARGSGADGLAGMAPIVEHASCRVLRPLLAVAKRDLRELLRVSDLRWIEDPSNRDLRFARARLRVEDAQWNAIEPPMAAAELRSARERRVAALLAAAVDRRPNGVTMIELERLRRASADDRFVVVQAIATSLSARPNPPRRESTARVAEWLAADSASAAVTFAGCVWRRRGGRIAVRPETSGARHAAMDAAHPMPGNLRSPIGAARGHCLDDVAASVQVNYGRALAAADSVAGFENVVRPARPLCSAAFAGSRALSRHDGGDPGGGEDAVARGGSLPAAPCERLGRP